MKIVKNTTVHFEDMEVTQSLLVKGTNEVIVHFDNENRITSVQGNPYLLVVNGQTLIDNRKSKSKHNNSAETAEENASKRKSK